MSCARLWPLALILPLALAPSLANADPDGPVVERCVAPGTPVRAIGLDIVERARSLAAQLCSARAEELAREVVRFDARAEDERRTNDPDSWTITTNERQRDAAFVALQKAALAFERR